MNMPGFDAESSLGPTIGRYRGKAVSGGLDAGGVLPMQEFLALSTLSRNLGLCWGTWRGCYHEGIPHGRHGYVEWRCVSHLEVCDCLYGFGFFCHPKIFQNTE